MKKLSSSLFALCTLLAVSCSSTSTETFAPTFAEGSNPAPDGNWTLVEHLSDEFNVDGLDTKKWSPDPKALGWGWMGRQPGLFQPKNVTVSDGSLQIAAGVLDEPVYIEQRDGSKTEFKYFGGIVRSTTPTSKMGRYFECRMKMNKSEMGGGFWLMVRDEVEGKKHEIDIVECVGHTSELTTDWGRDWNHIMHSNAIHRVTKANPVESRDENFVLIDTKNHENFHVYGGWWKSPKELLFYLDGEYIYTLVPPVDFDLDSFVQMSIEYYDWNPIPEDGGVLATLSGDDLISYFDWVRVWDLEE